MPEWLNVTLGSVDADAVLVGPHWELFVRPFPECRSVVVPMQRSRLQQIIDSSLLLTEEVNMKAQVEAARIPDRDRLLGELREAGIDARPVGEVGIEVPEPEQLANELFEHAEAVIMSIGAPFVPIKHEGVIYIRPPLS